MTKKDIEYKKFSNGMDKQLSTVYDQILSLIDIIEERIKNEENLTDDEVQPSIHKTLFDALIGFFSDYYTVDELCEEVKEAFTFYSEDVQLSEVQNDLI